MKIFSTTPPRPCCCFKPQPNVCSDKSTVAYIRMFRAPPLISLPITNPPCEAHKQCSQWIVTFSVGIPFFFLRYHDHFSYIKHHRPHQSGIFDQYVLQLSTSMPSPFCAYQGFLQTHFLLSGVHTSVDAGTRLLSFESHPSINMFLQLISKSRLGRRKSLTLL